MNVSSVNTSDYENQWLHSPPKNKPNTNPTKPNLKNAEINVNSVKARDYGNKRLFAPRQNKPNSNPIKPNFRPSPLFTHKNIPDIEQELGMINDRNVK